MPACGCSNLRKLSFSSPHTVLGSMTSASDASMPAVQTSQMQTQCGIKANRQ